eukprot:CAMPEP_0183705560 /NCGR_PEP_ID=MMETSP0737-20130205/2611_1 /TAXON_ID=385413 /ORGANISM="Thalassiosira miniscula, Strain CCMP1093" /LENGTH=330 /DNA_ID=CAMNT_0025932729 /DNA_START=125 /DNA_END=1118 /DNA_ORIENTATION=-
MPADALQKHEVLRIDNLAQNKFWQQPPHDAGQKDKSIIPANNASSSSFEGNERLYTFMTKQRGTLVSLSDFCGHVGFLLTVTAYLNTDMLSLRCLAISSSMMTTSFNYFRPHPLWFPIKWHALLITINAFMVGSLLQEKYEADNMPPEKKRLYDSGEFDDRGFSKVQFKKFFEYGRPRVLNQELITQENREIEKLYYIIDGNATVSCSKEGRTLGKITPNHFVGEMAFLVYCQNLKKDKETSRARASANVMADGMVRAWEWDAQQLAQMLNDDRDLSNAFTSYCSHDLRAKLLSANAHGDVKSRDVVEKAIKKHGTVKFLERLGLASPES